MNLSEAELEEVTALSKLGMCIDDIAVIMEHDLEPFREDFMDEGKFYKAYKKGQLLTEVELRKSVFKLAKMGHVVAQKRAEKYLQDQKIKDE